MIHLGKDAALQQLTAEAARLPKHYQGCAMCALVDGFFEDTEVLASTPLALAVLDRFAARPGHVLVILRRHVETITELSWEEYAAVQRLAWETLQTLERSLSPCRIYVAALGSAATRTTSFPHHHIHVVPLSDGGEADRPCRVFSWEPGVYLYAPGEARLLADRLRKDWDKPLVSTS